jgi:hypothetical protein
MNPELVAVACSVDEVRSAVKETRAAASVRPLTKDALKKVKVSGKRPGRVISHAENADRYMARAALDIESQLDHVRIFAVLDLDLETLSPRVARDVVNAVDREIIRLRRIRKFVMSRTEGDGVR